MAPPEPALRAVHVLGLVGVLVVVAVVRGPPEHALLRAGLGPECEHELEDASGLEAPVRSVPVVSDRRPRHPRVVEQKGECHQRPGEREEEGRDDRHRVGGEEGDRAPQVQLLVLASREGARFVHLEDLRGLAADRGVRGEG